MSDSLEQFQKRHWNSHQNPGCPAKALTVGSGAPDRRAHNPEVAGSNPVPATKQKTRFRPGLFLCHRVATSVAGGLATRCRGYPARSAFGLQILSPQPNKKTRFRPGLFSIPPVSDLGRRCPQPFGPPERLFVPCKSYTRFAGTRQANKKTRFGASPSAARSLSHQ